MKKILSIMMMLVAVVCLNAEIKIGYVDSEAVMKSYKKAEQVKEKLESEYKKWETKFRQMDENIKSKVEEYETRKSLMNEESKRELETEIKNLQQEAQNKYMQVMGEGGELSKKQLEFMQPLLEEIQAVIKTVRTRDNFTIIFDKQTSGIIDADENLDITELVIKELKKVE